MGTKNNDFKKMNYYSRYMRLFVAGGGGGGRGTGGEGGVLPMMAYLFREKWYIKGKGLVLGEEPPRMNIC